MRSGGEQKNGAREPARRVENKKPNPEGLGSENLSRIWRFQGATDGPSIESSLLDTPEMRKLRVSPAPLLQSLGTVALEALGDLPSRKSTWHLAAPSIRPLARSRATTRQFSILEFFLVLVPPSRSMGLSFRVPAGSAGKSQELVTMGIMTLITLVPPAWALVAAIRQAGRAPGSPHQLC